MPWGNFIFFLENGNIQDATWRYNSAGLGDTILKWRYNSAGLGDTILGDTIVQDMEMKNMDEEMSVD